MNENDKSSQELTPAFPSPAGLSSDGQPLVLLELIQRLKVRDVMTTNPPSVTPKATMRDIQNLMRTKKIGGVPVVENDRFYGLVSLDDIIRALTAGYIDDTCNKHMTTKLVNLEDDMPLSFALRYFDRYHYGRFPVISREQHLVGLISERDINRALLLELTHELNRLENQSSKNGEDAASGLYVLREFPICKYDFENAGKAANQIKKVLQEKQFPPKTIRRIAVAAYELEINLCVHSDGGVLSWKIVNGRSEIISQDTGPGIEDVEWACRDGTSTASEWIRSLGFGAGMGLANVKRVSDEFEISSKKGSGTFVKSVINLHA